MLETDEFVLRRATARDAETISRQRVRMFEDSGQADAEAMERMAASFVGWVRPRLENGVYVGWMIESGGMVVAGAGMWVMDFPPHWMDAEPARAYLLNFYVNPERRGKGLAQRLLEAALAGAKERGIKVVSLHASKFGRPVYAKNGFLDSNEMLLRVD